MPRRGTIRGRFEKGPIVGIPMQALRRPFLMLVLLVLTSLSPMLSAQSEPQDLPESEPGFMTEQQRLELASSMWHVATPSERFVTSLQPATGELHMNIGSVSYTHLRAHET